MKTQKLLWIVVVVSFAVLSFGITRNKPEDKVVLRQYTVETGRYLYDIDLYDDKGNYAGNFLRVKFYGDIKGIAVNGAEPWPEDPNYYLVLNAIPDPLLQYDPNNPAHVADPNIVTRLVGSIELGKTWGPGHYEIGIQVFDVADHNDCKWLILNVEDLTPPNVFGCR